jgi:hypothetical protein
LGTRNIAAHFSKDECHLEWGRPNKGMQQTSDAMPTMNASLAADAQRSADMKNLGARESEAVRG